MSKEKYFWVRQGNIFNACQPSTWMQSRAFLPTPYLIRKEVIRVYCSFLDDQNRGRIGYVDVEAKNPKNILQISKVPCLDIGEKDKFDQDGVNPSCVIPFQDSLIMFYQGWKHLTSTEHTILSGYAVSTDGGHSFKRGSDLPILKSIPNEKYIRSAPFVIKEEGNFRIWYCAGEKFIRVNQKMLPTYGISTITSNTLFNFTNNSIPCIVPPFNTDIFGYARPYIMKKSGKYLIWYSERAVSVPYKIKFASSEDGISWINHENFLGLQSSGQGWDSDMVFIGAILETNYGTYMFYNGNGYGSTGFGYAILNGNLNEIAESL